MIETGCGPGAPPGETTLAEAQAELDALGLPTGFWENSAVTSCIGRNPDVPGIAWPDEDPVEGFADPWGSRSAAELDGSVVTGLRAELADAVLPGQEAALIDLIRELEDLKSAAAALQARATMSFDTTRRQAEADRGLGISRRGKGIGAEVALARRESPHRGGRLLGLARALVTELPHTLNALTTGALNEWRATLVARETACLSPELRAVVDQWLKGYLVDHPSVGDKQLVADVQAQVILLDPDAVVGRKAKAAGERRVSTRPLPDGMVQFNAVLPLKEGIAVYAALNQAAEQAQATWAVSETRSRAAIMADTLVERVTGRPAHDPAKVTINVVITDQALLGESNEPAQVQGHGPVSAAWVRRLVAETIDGEQRVELRRLFRGPGRLIRMESASRFFPKALALLIAFRDQRCRRPWCGAPIRQTDHAQDRARGGDTDYVNGQGLCEACNHTKQANGWKATARLDLERGHVVTTTTPTAHVYESTQPLGPGD
ncbi:MAG: DUF222 domain-containing protein [Propionibacteriaceae bacterium]|nr:DUF222 domain-containing protein [Propionibacteriaceae bacterium]